LLRGAALRITPTWVPRWALARGLVVKPARAFVAVADLALGLAARCALLVAGKSLRGASARGLSREGRWRERLKPWPLRRCWASPSPANSGRGARAWSLPRRLLPLL
jgi:hypothetical protein